YFSPVVDIAVGKQPAANKHLDRAAPRRRRPEPHAVDGRGKAECGERSNRLRNRTDRRPCQDIGLPLTVQLRQYRPAPGGSLTSWNDSSAGLYLLLSACAPYQPTLAP